MLWGLLLVLLFIEGASSQSSEHRLRVNWTTGQVYTPLARTIKAHQTSCTPIVYYFGHNNYGMGSDLHTWTQALCNSMEKKATLLEPDTQWIWNDKTFCGTAKQPALKCYFNQGQRCPQSKDLGPGKNYMHHNNSFERCPTYIRDIQTRMEFRAAAIEFLFSNVSQKLIKDTEKEISAIFGDYGIPENMITMHLRWGDKRREMKLVTQQEYVDAVDKIAQNFSLTHPKIFVTTESKEALTKIEQYVKEHKPTWTLYNYPPSTYEGPTIAPNHGRHPKDKLGAPATSPMNMARHTGGVIGKASIVALLLALESKFYVLTSGSNWSRLIDELRRNVLDNRCGNCTHMVDLRQGFADHNWRRRLLRGMGSGGRGREMEGKESQRGSVLDNFMNQLLGSAVDTQHENQHLNNEFMV